MAPELVDGLLLEEHITDKAKVETFLATSLGLRPASQVTIPAEFPNGAYLGNLIDEEVKPHLLRIQSIKDPKAKGFALRSVRKLLEDSFERIVEGSEPYHAYYSWADKLGLRKNQITVRPTVHELYLYREKQVGERIRKLMRERDKIRKKTQRRPGPNVDNIRFAYPEEFDRKWLLQNGEVLGYPECCVSAYARDRVEGVNVEARASKQLIEALDRRNVDPHVYFTGFFFPCSPQCENALAKGVLWHETFRGIDDRLSVLYCETINKNTELVLRQPELIQKYLSSVKNA